MDKANSIANMLDTLKTLHENGICRTIFISPIFPCITDCIAIMGKAKDYIDEFWFGNLNLRGSFKVTILAYIDEKYPQFKELYKSIYIKSDKCYWKELAIALDIYCHENDIHYMNYFYHEELVEAKLAW